MKRKLLSIFLMLALVLSLSAFGLTAFADNTPTPNDTITKVEYVNIAGGWGMGLAVSSFNDTETYWQDAEMSDYVVVKKADGSVVECTDAGIKKTEYCGSQMAVLRGQGYVPAAGDSITFKAGFTYSNCYLAEDIVFVYVGTSYVKQLPESAISEITVEQVNYNQDWGGPTLQFVLSIANASAYGQFSSGDVSHLSYVNAYGESKPLADCTYVGSKNYVTRLAADLNMTNKYEPMVGDKFTVQKGFLLTQADKGERVNADCVYIATKNESGYFMYIPYVPATHDVTSFEITNDVNDNVVYIEANKQLTFTANDGALFTPKFTSSNEDVLTVDANGVMTGVAAGTATVTAKAGTIEKTYNVVVKAAPVMTSLKQKVAYEIVALKGEEAKIPANFSVVKVYNDGSESAPIMLTAENARFKETVDTSVVPDVTGKIKATLVVTVDGKDYEFEQWVRIHEVSVIDNFKECAVVEWFGFASFVEFPNNTTNKANFTDVSALKDYFDHIEYYRDGEKISCGSYLLGGGNIALFPAHAQPEVQEITLENYGTAMYKKGDTVKLLAGLTVYGHTGITDANNGVWSDEEGMLYKDAVLDHDVMFRFNGIGWDLYVPYTDVTVENATMEVALGTDNATVGAKRVPDSATVGKFSYTVDKPEILTVAENGKITAKKVGTAVITITLAEEDGSNAKTTTVTVTVVNKIVKLVVEKLVIEKGTQTIDLSLLKGKYVYGDGTEEIATDLATGKLAGFDPESEDAEQNLVIRVTHNGVDYTATVIVSFADDSGACIGSVNVETYAAIAIALAAFSAVVLLRKKQEN